MATASAIQRTDEILSGSVDRANFTDVVSQIYESYPCVDLAHSRIRQMEADLPKADGEAARDLAEKVGILLYAMGDYASALENLTHVRTRKTSAHFLGRTYLRMGREKLAIEWLEKGRSGDDDIETDVMLLEAHCRLRDHAAAEKFAKSIAAGHGDSPPGLYAQGLVADLKGDYAAAMDFYRAALDKDPEHAESLFRLAADCDLNGEDDRAVELYRRCAALKPTYIGALINLGILYEDRGMYYDAIDCYKRVLAIDPRHKQARLYLKDAESSLNMFIDLGRIRRMQRMQEVFSLPVSNFELSARSRSTLDRMDIKTLGGLTQLTRQELLNEKNFGDTSLTEIEDLLHRYDLELGASAEGSGPDAMQIGLEDDSLREKLNTPVEELDFSTRCRKCMERLNVATVGELARLTEQQLLDTPNFGVTSLQEVKRKLAALGLSLKGE